MRAARTGRRGPWMTGLGCALAALGAGASAARADAGRAPLARVNAEVTAIDREARTLSLASDDGARVDVSVPSGVKTFDRLLAGDRVRVQYAEPLALSMAPAGVPAFDDGERAGRGDPQTVTAPAEIVVIYLTASRVAVRSERGRLTTLPVSDPELRRRLPAFRPGQMVALTYRRAVAASIEISRQIARRPTAKPAADSRSRRGPAAAAALLPPRR